MDLKNISNQDLCSRMEKLVRTERRITHLVLVHILEIESRRIYAELGYDGMFSYLTKCLGYSESGAYRRLQSSRVLKHVPAAAAKLEDGSLNLSQLTQVQKCLKEEAKMNAMPLSAERTQAVLQKIEHKNTFETERVLAVEFNKPVQIHEVIKPQKDDSVRLEITLSHEQFAELEKARSLLSHVCPEGSWSEVLSTIALKFNQGKLGGTATQGFAATAVTADSLAASKVETVIMQKKNQRPYLSIKTKRALIDKANSCCEYQDPQSGKKCDSSYQLQVDHILPWSLGGSHSSKNLRILCRTHNLLMARNYGLGRPIDKL